MTTSMYINMFVCCFIKLTLFACVWRGSCARYTWA